MNDDRDRMVDQLLDEWEDAFEAGLNILPEELCADHPELLDAVRSKIEILMKMDQKLASGISNDSAEDTAGKKRADDSFRIDSKYDDLEVLDSGGLGIVYRAVDTVLNRDIAVKFLRDPGQNKKLLEQFKAEAEITGRLDHPGVVPVYAMGRAKSGEPFYSMRLIRGDTLDHAIKEFHGRKAYMKNGERWIETRQLLARFVSVCKTIAYAHTRGILHRDIKPHNIMLGKYGESLVVDWGLAVPFDRQGKFRVLDEKTLLPVKGEAHAASPDGFGTPAYMSPEQASGNQKLEATSDIFSLGATLYKLLTGEIPFKGKNSLETKQLILQGEFKLPHQVDRRVSTAISRVCAKALAHKTTERYQTALELAEDVERYLADEPVSAYQESLGRRLGRWTRRHRSLAQWLTAALVMAFAAASVTSIVQYRAREEQNKNQVKLDQSLARSQKARQNSIRMSTQLIANSIQFDLQNRFSFLDQVERRMAAEQIESLDESSIEQINSILDSIRYDTDCITPSLAWFVRNENGETISFLSDSTTESSFAGESIKQLKASDLTVPFLSPVRLSVEQNQMICSVSRPINVGESTIVVGIVIDLVERCSVFAEELEIAEENRMSLVEHSGQGESLCFFDGAGTDSFESSPSENSELTKWVVKNVVGNDSIAVSMNDERVRAGSKINVKTAKLEPVDCNWYLVIEQ